MREAHGVRTIHDLHVWTLTSGKDAMSAHVLVESIADGRHVLGDLQDLLRTRFGIEHVTIQLESDQSPLVQIGRPSPMPATDIQPGVPVAARDPSVTDGAPRDRDGKPGS